MDGRSNVFKEIIWIAAPMIKVSSLPFRLTCLDFGADIVYSDELIGTTLGEATRRVDPLSGVIEFCSPGCINPIFTTCSIETGRVVAQLGVPNAAVALKAATVVANDVCGIDINMGCPKSFSIKHGMGAKLLTCPETVEDILKTLKRNLPEHLRLTCKIRLQDQLANTVEFVRRCEKAGVSAIAVHARRVRDRPTEPAQWNVFSTLKSAVSVPLIANGDLTNRRTVELFYQQYMKSTATEVHRPDVQLQSVTTADTPVVDALMFARGAHWNPSLFSLKPYVNSDNTVEEKVKFYSLKSVRTCILRILHHALATRTPATTLKWMILEMVSQDPSLRNLEQRIRCASTIDSLQRLFSASEFDLGGSDQKKRQRQE